MRAVLLYHLEQKINGTAMSMKFILKTQVVKICENECIGFNVTNRRERTISVEKGGQSIAALSVWANVRMDDDPVKNPY